MFLHEDKNAFEYLLTNVSAATGIDEGILEKDYYVTVFLKKLADKQKKGYRAYFKGGTALYKYLKKVGRFSEDIDLTVDTSGLNRTQQDKHLAAVTKKYDGFERLVGEGVTNRQTVLSVYSYNSLSDVFKFDSLDRFGKVKIEATSFTISEPVEDLVVTSLLFDHSLDSEKDLLRDKFNAGPFSVKAITLERMFVDKLFAAEAYVRRFAHEDKGLEASKHLYDLTVMSSLPRIVDLLGDEDSLEKMISIQMREEMNRLGGVPGLLPKNFEVFDRIQDDFRLHDAFRRTEDIYVLYDNDRFTVDTMLDTMRGLRKSLFLNSSWTKDVYDKYGHCKDDDSLEGTVDHSDVGNVNGSEIRKGPEIS